MIPTGKLDALIQYQDVYWYVPASNGASRKDWRIRIDYRELFHLHVQSHPATEYISTPLELHKASQEGTGS
jgi:hypothetical protein